MLSLHFLLIAFLNVDKTINFKFNFVEPEDDCKAKTYTLCVDKNYYYY